MTEDTRKRIKEQRHILWKHGIFQKEIAAWIKSRKKKRGFTQPSISKLLANSHLNAKHYDFSGYMEEIIEELKEKELFFEEEPDLSDDTKQKIRKAIFPDTTGEAAEKQTGKGRKHWKEMELIGPWQIGEDGNTITGEGLERYLITRRNYGDRDFTIFARVIFGLISEPHLFNAGFLLGWNEYSYDNSFLIREYHNLLFLNDAVILEKVGFNQGDGFLDFTHLSGHKEFEVEINRAYDIVITVHGQSIRLYMDNFLVFAAERPPNIYGKVGIRPWRSRMALQHFLVEEVNAG